ncbi:MAG: T9SS type A sorting domain-containing protein [Calditrichaeota bacterium]|nr:T9SS type A sorting domain-containing protein [Calditrichota bacterium]MCB9367364.1 T9SS type A sorting domain-containing protein [Calditrichota bacterium]MCB9391330.1 T9SS type A sorting domain-containing protein [Calditrichota bacterium]
MKWLILALVLTATAANCGLPVTVLGSGAQHAASPTGSTIQGTLGQMCGARVSAPLSVLHAGFWPAARAEHGLAAQDETVELPKSFEFFPAYPNPFNPVTQLRFSLPRAAHANLILFDVTGRQVATLADGEFNAGQHELFWNAEAFASGTYFARLETADITHTQKLILIK